MRFGKIGPRKMMHHGPVLPFGARWVEYLESSNGQQWIDTGVFPALPCHVKSRVSFASINIYQGGVACGWGDNNTQFAAPMMHSSGQPTLAAPGIGYTRYTNLAQGTLLDTEMDFVADGSGVYTLNGESVSVTRWKTPVSGLKDHIYLFAIGHSGTTAFYRMTAGGRIYYADIDCGDTSLRLIPIAIGNKGYMLDLLTGEYEQYGNKGTGEFVIGPTIAYPERERERE